MFPFWYGHYPYQVAEYDECPVSGPWDFPRPLMAPVPEERWSRPSVLWRPWFSKGTDLFSFFQVETMVVRRGKGRPMSKRTDSLLRAFTGAKILKEAPDVYSSLSWSLSLKKQHSYVRRQPLCKAIPWVLSLGLQTFPWCDQSGKKMKVDQRSLITIMKDVAPILSVEVRGALAQVWPGDLWDQEAGLVYLFVLSSAWSFIMLNVFLLNWMSQYGLCSQKFQSKSNNKNTVTNIWKKH